MTGIITRSSSFAVAVALLIIIVLSSFTTSTNAAAAAAATTVTASTADASSSSKSSSSSNSSSSRSSSITIEDFSSGPINKWTTMNGKHTNITAQHCTTKINNCYFVSSRLSFFFFFRVFLSYSNKSFITFYHFLSLSSSISFLFCLFLFCRRRRRRHFSSHTYCRSCYGW
jgi:hypothetical protein